MGGWYILVFFFAFPSSAIVSVMHAHELKYMSVIVILKKLVLSIFTFNHFKCFAYFIGFSNYFTKFILLTFIGIPNFALWVPYRFCLFWRGWCPSICFYFILVGGDSVLDLVIGEEISSCDCSISLSNCALRFLGLIGDAFLVGDPPGFLVFFLSRPILLFLMLVSVTGLLQILKLNNEITMPYLTVLLLWKIRYNSVLTYDLKSCRF